MIMELILFIILGGGCVVMLSVIGLKAWTDTKFWSFHPFSSGEPWDELIMRKALAIICFGGALYVIEFLVRLFL